MKIIVICSENYSLSNSPLARTVRSTVLAYRKLGVDVLGFSPLYSQQFDKKDCKSSLKFIEKLGSREYGVQMCAENKEDLFIQNEDYFGRVGIYGERNGKNYSDNHLRFSFLASAALDYCERQDFKPDAIHLHEWCGIAGALTKTVYKDYFADIPVILTIHNMNYDYLCSSKDISKIGLPPQDFDIDGYEFWGKVSMLKAAMLYSDKVVFTSLSYLFYLLFTDTKGGMRGFLDSIDSKLFGIQNGIDYDMWSIPANAEEFKLIAKNSLRQKLGLEVDSSMLVYVHLDDESGSSVQVLSTILADLLNLNIELVIGIEENNPSYSYFSAIQKKHKKKIALIPLQKDDDSLYNRLIAADLFFSINSNEPSLSIFLKAFATGTVALTNKRSQKPFIYIIPFSKNFDENNFKATSFISDGSDPDLILNQVRIAESIFCGNRSLWSRLVHNALVTKVSWEDTVKNYLRLLSEIEG